LIYKNFQNMNRRLLKNWRCLEAPLIALPMSGFPVSLSKIHEEKHSSSIQIYQLIRMVHFGPIILIFWKRPSNLNQAIKRESDVGYGRSSMANLISWWSGSICQLWKKVLTMQLPCPYYVAKGNHDEYPKSRGWSIGVSLQILIFSCQRSVWDDLSSISSNEAGD